MEERGQYKSSELTKRLKQDGEEGERTGRFSVIKNRLHELRTQFGSKAGDSGRVVGGSFSRTSGHGEAAPASAAREGRPVLERMSAPPFGSSPRSARQSSMPSSPTYFERMSASVKEEGCGIDKVNSPFHWCDMVEGSAYNQSSGILSYDMEAYRHGPFTPYDPSKSMKQQDGDDGE